MQKQRIEYDSPVDAIVALAKRLSVNEDRYGLMSEEFYDKFRKGELDDNINFIEWANDYENFLAIKLDLENRISHAA